VLTFFDSELISNTSATLSTPAVDCQNVSKFPSKTFERECSLFGSDELQTNGTLCRGFKSTKYKWKRIIYIVVSSCNVFDDAVETIGHTIWRQIFVIKSFCFETNKLT